MSVDAKDAPGAAPAPLEIDVDARREYAAFLATSTQFLGVPGGGVKVLAALIELFDELLRKAPEQTQTVFWNLVESKLERARTFLVPTDPKDIM